MIAGVNHERVLSEERTGKRQISIKDVSNANIFGSAFDNGMGDNSSLNRLGVKGKNGEIGISSFKIGASQ